MFRLKKLRKKKS